MRSSDRGQPRREYAAELCSGCWPAPRLCGTGRLLEAGRGAPETGSPASPWRPKSQARRQSCCAEDKPDRVCAGAQIARGTPVSYSETSRFVPSSGEINGLHSYMVKASEELAWVFEVFDSRQQSFAGKALDVHSNGPL